MPTGARSGPPLHAGTRKWFSPHLSLARWNDSAPRSALPCERGVIRPLRARRSHRKRKRATGARAKKRHRRKKSGVVYNPQWPRLQPTHSPLRPTSETAIMNDSLQASLPRSASNLARMFHLCNRDASRIGSPFTWPDPSGPCTFAVWQNANAKPSLLTLGPRLAFSLPLCAGHPRSECISQSRRARGCT